VADFQAKPMPTWSGAPPRMAGVPSAAYAGDRLRRDN
jgi:hypothetical protein